MIGSGYILRILYLQRLNKGRSYLSIKESEILIKVSGRQIEYYRKLGYNVPTYNDKYGNNVVKKGTLIKVKIEDLPP